MVGKDEHHPLRHSLRRNGVDDNPTYIRTGVGNRYDEARARGIQCVELADADGKDHDLGLRRSPTESGWPHGTGVRG